MQERQLRILMVENEEAIRNMLTVRLQHDGYLVVAAANVAEAIAVIGSEAEFDVLLTDLHIGQPGDGFTIASAMRRTKPETATVIMTGFPDFEEALHAIRSHVDGYVTKPLDYEKLKNIMTQCYFQAAGNIQREAADKNAATIIEESSTQIAELWLQMTENVLLEHNIQEDRAQRLLYIKGVIAGLVNSLKARRSTPDDSQISRASMYGRSRKAENWPPVLLIEESRMLQRSIYDALQSNLLVADLSQLIPDMISINDILHEKLAESLKVFLG